MCYPNILLVRMKHQIESAQELSRDVAVHPENGLVMVAGGPLQTGPLEKQIFHLPPWICFDKAICDILD